MFSYLQMFCLLWAYRYVRLIVNLISSWTFPPIPLPEAPTFFPSDVTVVIPTITGEGDEFLECLKSCTRCKPDAIIIVTTYDHVTRLQRLCETIPKSQIQVLGVKKACKRLQMIQGLLKVRTALTVFADDDVVWPRTFLRYLLAAFEDDQVGAAGTCQRVRRVANPSLWNVLGAFYLERRNFEISATSHIDGGISCLSGRTSAFRTHILQNNVFVDAFANETWLGRIPLSTADDDNFLTRWMVSHGWRIKIQFCKEAEIMTTLNDDSSFLNQCVRWARSNWRSNITSMMVERHIWRQQPWCAYALHLATFGPPALIMDGLLAWLLFKATKDVPEWNSTSVLVGFIIWLVFAKAVKLVPHFYRYPMDIKFIPLAMVFGYLHGFIKIYALLTVNETAWGGRGTMSEVKAWGLEGSGFDVLGRAGRVGPV